MGTKSTAFSSLNINEPYRATRLWNEIVKTFRSELPRGYHRRRMKSYEDCFVASEAVDWLLNYLRGSPDFGPEVSRQQATQLLQKFYQCDLIQNVSCKKKGVFEDTKELYSVKKSTPLKSPAPRCLKKLMRTPVTLGELKTGEEETETICSSVLENKLATAEIDNLPVPMKNSICESKVCTGLKPSVLTPQEIANIWKSVLWNKLSVAIALKNLESVLKPQDVHGHIIIHNVSNVQRNGIIALTDKSDDIPNWIMCAMKCLARWPNASGSSSCLPNYPGFEKDVFKVVKEYFFGLDGPLIPRKFFSIVSALYDFATMPKKLTDAKGNSASSCSIPLSVASEPATCFTGNNLVGTKPLQRTEITCSDAHLNIAPVCNKPVQPSQSSDAILEQCKERTSYCFETVFANDYPVTRVVRRPSNLNPNHKPGINAKPTTSHEPGLLRRTKCLVGRKQYRSLERNESRPVLRVAPQRSASLKCLSLNNFGAQGKRFQFERREKRRTGLHEVYYGKSFDKLEKPGTLNNQKTTSCDNISVVSSVISADSAQLRMIIQNPYTNCDDQDKKVDQGILRSNSSAESGNKKLFRENIRCRSALGQMTTAGNDVARPISLPRSHRLVKCFQLVLLLIPVSNRRKLHLLLRFLNKIKQNRSLQLFSKEHTSLMIVKMFWKCILGPPDPTTEASETIGCQVGEFLLDHCEAILAPPVELKMEVENVVTLLSQSRMRHSKEGSENIPDLDHPVTFCEQMTNQMYEDQKMAVLHVSLKGLLEEILTNPLLSSKDRTKKLHKFRKQYPEVYAEKFPPEDGIQMKRKRSIFKTLRNIRL